MPASGTIYPYLFREYDIRGQVRPGELDEDAARAIGRGFGTYLVRRGHTRVVIGHDSRAYSPGLGDALAEGLLSTGLNVVDLGLSLSPMVYFAQHHLEIPAGVMVTASHNPNGWGGFKMGDAPSRTLLPKGIREIHQTILNGDYAVGQGTRAPGDIREAYSAALTSRVQLARPVRVVVDCGNGTAGAFTPEILRRAGADVVELYCELDSTFPNHEPNPSLLEARTALAVKVRETGADLGIGIDGDGDRIGVLDDRGENVWSDIVLIFLARQLLEKYPGGKIVFDVKCSQSLIEAIAAAGGEPVMWKTGHSYIKAKGAETGALLAGERSGHIFYFADFYGFDDANYAALKLVEYLSRQERPLSDMIAETAGYVASPEIEVECSDAEKYQVVERITEQFRAEFGADRVIDINGARVQFEDGWGLARASSNLPQLVLVFEGRTPERLAEIKQLFRERLSRFPQLGAWHNE